MRYRMWVITSVIAMLIVAVIILAITDADKSESKMMMLLGLIALSVTSLVNTLKQDETTAKVEELNHTIQNGGTVAPMARALNSDEGQAAIVKAIVTANRTESQ